MYALEQAGRLLSPEEYCEGIESITDETDKMEQARIWDEFLAYTSLIERVYEEVESAYILVTTHTIEQFDLAKHSVLAAEREINSMFRSSNDSFRRFGLKTQRITSLMLQIMYTKQNGKDPIKTMPNSDDYNNAAS
jgi:hypothetical protein